LRYPLLPRREELAAVGVDDADIGRQRHEADQEDQFFERHLRDRDFERRYFLGNTEVFFKKLISVVAGRQLQQNGARCRRRRRRRRRRRFFGLVRCTRGHNSFDFVPTLLKKKISQEQKKMVCLENSLNKNQTKQKDFLINKTCCQKYFFERSTRLVSSSGSRFFCSGRLRS